MIHSRRLLLFAGLLLGCHGEAAKPASPTSARTDDARAELQEKGIILPDDARPGERVHVYMGIDALTAAGERSLQSGEVLKSGDRFALRMVVDKPTYLYAIYADPKGIVTRLFPSRGDEMVKPGTTRVPADGWITLDRETGQENFFIVASAQPVAQDALDRQVKDSLSDHSEAGVDGGDHGQDAQEGAHEEKVRPQDDKDNAPAADTSRRKPRSRPPQAHVAPPKAAPAGQDPPPPALLNMVSSRRLFLKSTKKGIIIDQKSLRVEMARFSIQHR